MIISIQIDPNKEQDIIQLRALTNLLAGSETPTPVPNVESLPPIPASDPELVEVKLKELQDLATKLLQAGERKTFTSILANFGAKNLTSAPKDKYPELFEQLKVAVAKL